MEHKIHTEHLSRQSQRPVDSETLSSPKNDVDRQSAFRSLLGRSDRDGIDSDLPSPLAQGGSATSAESCISGHQELDSFQVTNGMVRSPPGAQRAVVNVDTVLAHGARDVQLATDGRDHYVLRFEVASGDLQGARISVSSAGGIVSAIAIPPSVESALRLEHALDEARLSLEERGIDVAGLEVRAGDDDGRDRCFEEDETNHDEIDNDVPRRAMRAIVDHSETRGVDYFV